MTRSHKILMAIAMTLAAIGVWSTAGAGAAEFHCAVAPCQITVKPDGTGKTAHQVISLTNGTSTFSTTCNTITGEAVSPTKTFTEITVTNIKGEGCTVAGIGSELKMNGCNYLYKATGTLTITCPIGKEIEDGIPGGCLYKIPPQGPLTGLKYHDAGTTKTELTVEMSIKNIALTAGKGCGWEGPGVGEFTTGNTILTSETGGVMSSIWYE